MTARIGVFLFEGAEELDWAGPWEVLGTWAQHWPQEAELFSVAAEAGPIRCAKGLRVVAEHSWQTAPDIDVLVYPGGFGTRAQLEDEAVLGWVRSQAESGTLMTSVCTGSLVYAAAGLLAGSPATSHWGALEHLRELDGTIEVRPHDRFVDTGSVVTAAGVSAGIDMALHLVARLSSRERAREVRRSIQYDPEPPV